MKDPKFLEKIHQYIVKRGSTKGLYKEIKAFVAKEKQTYRSMLTKTYHDLRKSGKYKLDVYKRVKARLSKEILGKISMAEAQALRQLNPGKQQLKKLSRQARNWKRNFKTEFRLSLTAQGRKTLSYGYLDVLQRDLQKNIQSIKETGMISDPFHWNFFPYKASEKTLQKQSQMKKEFLGEIKKVFRKFDRYGKAINFNQSWMSYRGEQISLQQLIYEMEHYTSLTPHQQKDIRNQFKAMIRKLKRLDPSKELFRTVKGNIGIKNSNRRWKDYGKSQEGGGAGEMEEYQTKDSYGNVISWYVNTSSKIVFSWTIITLNKDKPLDPEYHIEQLRTQMGGINENDTHTSSVLANFRSEFSDRLLGEEY